MNMSEKYIKQRETLRLTRLKRQSQKCRVIELKIDSSKLNDKELEQLKMYFVEAKWLYNFILSQENPFKYDYKTNPIKIKTKDGDFVDKELQYLPISCKQSIVNMLRQNIVNLSKAKKKGNKVGRLKFKSSYDSIDFCGYGRGRTHYITKDNKFKITGIKKHLKVFGLDQIKPTYEFANAKLIQKPSGYYIKLTTFEFITPDQLLNKPIKEVGLDFGIKNNITTSEGEIFNISIEETEHLKRLQRKLSRQQKGSNNRYKTRLKLQKEYEKITNKKKDVVNKLCNYLFTNYSKIYIQDELIHLWHKSLFGKQVQHSCLGLIKSTLKRSNSTTVISSLFPTTKMCYQCGTINNIDLSERTYRCQCGLVEDRDIKSAKTILHVGKCQTNYPIPTEHRNFKPVEKMSDLVKSPDLNMQFSMKQEAIAI